MLLAKSYAAMHVNCQNICTEYSQSPFTRHDVVIPDTTVLLYIIDREDVTMLMSDVSVHMKHMYRYFLYAIVFYLCSVSNGFYLCNVLHVTV